MQRCEVASPGTAGGFRLGKARGRSGHPLRAPGLIVDTSKHLTSLSGVDAMLARLKTFTLLGIEAMPVDVEVDISPAAMPKTILVGLPDTAVKESTHRVERAIVNSGFTRPHDRVVINLAPAIYPNKLPHSIFLLPSVYSPVAGN